MKKKLIILIYLLLIVFPVVAYADETIEYCKTHPCNKSQCGDSDSTSNAKVGLRADETGMYVTIGGQSYKAYCIDPGSAQGAGCDITCAPLPNDDFGDAYRKLLATATGTKEDVAAMRVLGILTGYTRVTNKSKYLKFYSGLIDEITGEITTNHTAYLRAYEALFGRDANTGQDSKEFDQQREEDQNKASKLTMKAVSASSGQVTIQVDSTKEIKKVKFKVEGGEIVSQSWNGTHGTVVVLDTDRDCNIGVEALFNGSNALLCKRGGSQQFIVDTSLDKNGVPIEAGAQFVTETDEDSEDDKDLAVATYSITADDFKTLDNGYYSTTCKDENTCPPVGEGESDLHNCCEDGGYVDVTEPELNDLFCREDALGVDYFKRRKGSDKYIKTDATFVDGDGTINGLAKKYCTVYCTQRAYIQIPGQPNSGKNGLYFELHKGDWGTASAYIKGTKRCRVRVDYDAWWIQYNEYIMKEIKAYNDFMMNAAVYRYIDDSSDTDSEIFKVKKEDYYVECTTGPEQKTHHERLQVGWDSRTNQPIEEDFYCTTYKTPSITDTKSHGLAIPNKNELSYNYILLSKDPAYNYQLIKWDENKKDKLYTSVEVEHGTAYENKKAMDIYKYQAIAAKRVEDKINERERVFGEYDGHTRDFAITISHSGDCDKVKPEEPKNPVWHCEHSTQEIEKYDTDFSKSSETPWIDVKNDYKSYAMRASSDFTSSTKDARDMERALDACNSYFLNETKNFTNLSVGGNNGYDAKKNYKMNSTYSFDYTQIYLDQMGEIRDFVTAIPFGPAKDTACYYTFDIAHSYDEYPGEAVGENGRTDMFKSYYSLLKYSKSGEGIKETYDDFSHLAKGAFQIEDEDGTYYRKNQTTTWFKNFLHRNVGELKEEVFKNDKRFNLDGLYKMECMWDETGEGLSTFVPNGSSNYLSREENVTSHNLQYSIFLTTFEGKYDTNHHIGCIGENCIFDDVVANGDACAADGGSRKKSSEDSGESAMSCSLKIDYSITLTGICHPNDITAQIPDCELFGNDYNLFEFKIADSKDVLPNLKSGSYDYADNWFDENGTKAKEQIQSDGKQDKTYSPDHMTYSFVLTPKVMRRIKAYDADATIDGGYTDFTLKCNCDGGACHKCISSFLTELNNGTFSDSNAKETWGNSSQTIQNVRSSNQHVHWKGAE